MKYFIILFAMALSSCSCDHAPHSGMPAGVDKFVDGNVTCYFYYSYGISCVRNQK